jgi:SAM-dependent methyltransferase
MNRMAGDYQSPERMAKKSQAIPLPDLRGKTVLDVGCDHGWWCWKAVELGAKKVLGLDRNRKVWGSEFDLIARNTREAGSRPCKFEKTDLGRQWREFGRHDVVFCFSMYHHVFANCGDHHAVWHWLHRHTRQVLLWENPTGTDDPVVRMHVDLPYTKDRILEAAGIFFDIEEIGAALHVPTRSVWRCTPHREEKQCWLAQMQPGSGGAAKAFQYAQGRRMGEIEEILGFRPVAGSLNCKVNRPFDWDGKYYRARILDPVSRANMDGEWAARWARFYPMTANGKRVFGFRFEGETYKDNFVELISDTVLREILPSEFELVG